MIRRLFQKLVMLSVLPTILDIDGMAALLKVKPAKLKKAVKIGQLSPGRHFFIIDDEVRFYPTGDLFRLIMEDCHKSAQIGQKIADMEKAKRPASSRRPRNNNAKVKERLAA